MYFVMTVDVEADDAWNSPDKIQLKNLAQIPKFQQLCDRYGIVPTYLLAYECACRDEAISVLKPISDSGKCEIGHHLHCWTTPPFEKEGPPGVDSAWIHAYQFELSDSLFAEKAECLRLAIERSYGCSPTSHRAGRWGIDQRSINWLVENGFVAESSVVPLMSFNKNMGKTREGPSFYSAPSKPFLWHSTAETKSGKTSIMEIPLTVYTPMHNMIKLIGEVSHLQIPGKRFAEMLYNKLLGLGGVLRPNPRYTEGKLLHMMEMESKHQQVVTNCMIHSSELALGCSPYSTNKHDCESVWGILEAVFNLVKQSGIRPLSLSQVAGRLELRSDLSKTGSCRK